MVKQYPMFKMSDLLLQLLLKWECSLLESTNFLKYCTFWYFTVNFTWPAIISILFADSSTQYANMGKPLQFMVVPRMNFWRPFLTRKNIFPWCISVWNRNFLLYLKWHWWYSANKIFIGQITVNQLNLTAVKISYLKTQAYLAQENLAFWKKGQIKKNHIWMFCISSQQIRT